MKLRIKGNSLRLRVTRSELEMLLQTGRIEDSICFTEDGQSRLTYALEHGPFVDEVTLQFTPPEISVILPSVQAKTWGNSDQTGIYATVTLGSRGLLEIAVEKDFACLDRSDSDNSDSFPNPHTGAEC